MLVQTEGLGLQQMRAAFFSFPPLFRAHTQQDGAHGSPAKRGCNRGRFDPPVRSSLPARPCPGLER